VKVEVIPDADLTIWLVLHPENEDEREGVSAFYEFFDLLDEDVIERRDGEIEIPVRLGVRREGKSLVIRISLM